MEVATVDIQSIVVCDENKESAMVGNGCVSGVLHSTLDEDSEKDCSKQESLENGPSPSPNPPLDEDSQKDCSKEKSLEHAPSPSPSPASESSPLPHGATSKDSPLLPSQNDREEDTVALPSSSPSRELGDESEAQPWLPKPTKLELQHSHAASSVRTSTTSLSGSKSRYHIQKGAGVGKSRGLTRTTKPATLEVALDLGTSPHVMSSPRILRSPGRKKSPIRWFPRKKTESFLERKIRMLQEKEGTVGSLDETLGAANPHMSRIERDKLAAQAAAEEAMNARKGALVEASWCRILKLAGIPCASAILDLQKAEKKASAALAEAANHGVILRNAPSAGVASVPTDLKPPSEAVTASLDTAFDVDKEVTAAIKSALHHISRFSDASPDERSMEMARSDTGDDAGSSISSESDNQSDLESDRDQRGCDDSKSNKTLPADLQAKRRRSQEASLTELMVARIRDLEDNHRVSLAAVVATRGLSALLKEQSLEQELNATESLVDSSMTTYDPASASPLKRPSASPKKASDLGSILVKHVSKLQREIQAAKKSITAGATIAMMGNRPTGGQQSSEIPSLDNLLLKHVSRLEKEKMAALAAQKTFDPPGRKAQKATPSLEEVLTKNPPRNAERKSFSELTNALVKREGQTKNPTGRKPAEVESLDKVLVKHMSRLEKEKLASQSRQEAMEEDKSELENAREGGGTPFSGDAKSYASPVLKKHQEDILPDLGSILVKHVSRLEREKQESARKKGESDKSTRQKKLDTDSMVEGAENDDVSKAAVELALSSDKTITDSPNTPKQNLNSNNEVDGLGSILVKHVSRLEKEKQAALKQQGGSSEPAMPSKQTCWEGGLSDILVKGDAQKLGRGRKMETKPSPSQIEEFIHRRKSLRERQLEEAWGGVGLGDALRRHVSKLELEQAAWRRAEEEAKKGHNTRQRDL